MFVAIGMHVGNFKRCPCTSSIWPANVTRRVKRLGPGSFGNTVGTEYFGTYKVNGMNFLAVIAIVNRYLLGFEVIGNDSVRFSGTSGFIWLDETLPFSMILMANSTVIFAAYMAMSSSAIQFAGI